MKCTCGVNVVTLERTMACPDCGATLVLPGSKATETLKAELAVGARLYAQQTDRLRELQLSAAQAEAAMLRGELMKITKVECSDSVINPYATYEAATTACFRIARNALAQPSPAAEKWAAINKVVEAALKRRQLEHDWTALTKPADDDDRRWTLTEAEAIVAHLRLSGIAEQEQREAVDALAALTEKREEGVA